MKVWNAGQWIEVNIGDRFFVGTCGSGHTVFGENATLVKANTHLVFQTDSGTIVKTKIDNLNDEVGKAKANNYFVSVGERKEDQYLKQAVCFWNAKKACFETK